MYAVKLFWPYTKIRPSWPLVPSRIVTFVLWAALAAEALATIVTLSITGRNGSAACSIILLIVVAEAFLTQARLLVL